MIPGEPEPAGRQRHVGRSEWLRCSNQGWWDAGVAAGAEVPAGGLLGSVRNLWGDVLEELRAPADGVALFVTSSPAVEAGGLLMGFGVDIS
jgi:predicted deacylase